MLSFDFQILHLPFHFHTQIIIEILVIEIIILAAMMTAIR